MPDAACPPSAAIPGPVPATTRRVELVVISDVHLGTRSCKAEELIAYLDGVQPGELVLNGDILDLRELRKGFWPAAHTEVVRRILAFADGGVPVHYVTGNHDVVLRLFSAFRSGSIHLVDHLERTLAGKRTLFVHGDLIEAGMGLPRWLRRIGCLGYHTVRGLDRLTNRGCRRLGLPQVDWARSLKAGKGASAHIARYEEHCANRAWSDGYAAVVAGHIHRPNIREIPAHGGSISYMNSGDWVEHGTALEFSAGIWRLAGAACPAPAARPLASAVLQSA